MSKKDYVAIAKVFAAQVATVDTETRATLHLIASELSGVFAHDNPAFVRSRFIAACGF